jgi:hypothetical protein
VWGAGATAAQEYSGKLQGRLTSSAGAILPAAQVLLIGTALGAVTDNNGSYFVNNVPVGTYTVRAQLIGYARAEVLGVRILGGQTTDLNVVLQEAAVAVSGVTVTAAGNGVARDQMASKTKVPGELIRNLPLDRLQDLVTLQPGVVEARGQDGLSIRGSRPGEAQVYIDGAPVRPVASAFRNAFGVNAGNVSERQTPLLGTNGVEEVTVTTGALGPGQGNAQAGAIVYATRSGGDRLGGSFSWESDEPFGTTLGQGLNRFEGALGGPVPGIPRLRFFMSGSLQGVRSAGAGAQTELQAGWERIPTYVLGRPDTTVAWETDTITHDSASVVLPTFVQVTGPCGTSGSAATPVSQDIQSNYGFACQGTRLPMNWRTDGQSQGKLLYSYGLGSTVSITGLANGVQRRYWPGAAIQDPALFDGEHRWSRAAILNLSHQVFRESGHALAFTLTASWQEDNLLAGPLSYGYERSSRSQPLGIELGTMQFAGLDAIPYPVTDDLVLAFHGGRGVVVPFGGRDDLRNIEQFRINPMGVVGGGWFSRGLDAEAQMHWERRYTVQPAVDWQLDRFQRLTFGGEGLWTNVAHWETKSLLNRSGAYMYHERPTVYALFGSDRVDLGDLVLEFGLRWDYFNTHSRFPNLSVYEPLADTSSAAIAAWFARTTIPSVGHATLSPRVRVSFPVAEHTDLRLSFGKQVEVPEFYFTFGSNDVTFGQTILYEFGLRHAFSGRTVLDVALYNKDIRSELTLRQVRLPDPRNPGEFHVTPLFVNLDFGYSRGGEVRLDLRPGGGVQATASYGYQTSRSTGSDPLTVFFGTIGQVTGLDSVFPAQALSVTSFDRTHSALGMLSWSVPRGSGAERFAHGILKDVQLFATGRYVSGLPYTSMDRAGRRLTIINDARRPALRNVDARITKTFRLRGLGAIAYIDVRNLLSFRNVRGINPVTGTVTDSFARAQTIQNQIVKLRGEAEVNGQTDTTGFNVGACAGWRHDPVDCVALNRVEARYGNGDGWFTLDEQRRAFGAAYDLDNGPQWFYGPPRRIRIGVEVTF